MEQQMETPVSEFSILNSFYASGKELTEFEDLVTEMNDQMEFVKVIPSEIRFMSFDKAVGNIAYFNRLSKKAIENFETDGILSEDIDHPESVRGRKVAIKIVPEMEEFIAECNQNRLFITYNDENKISHAAFVAPTGKAQFLQWIGLKGDVVINTDHLTVDLLLADLYRNFKKPLTMVIVKQQGSQGGNSVYRKVIGVLGPKYVRLPATIFPNAIRELQSERAGLGEQHVKGWRVDHRFTEIYVDFPQAAEEYSAAYGLPVTVTPGLRFCTSDIGGSSMTVEPAYWLNDGMAIGESMRQRHSGFVTPEIVAENIQLDIFTKLRDFPAALCDRLSVTIGNEDLTTSAGQQRNARLVARCIKVAIDELGIKKVLGAKRTKTVFKAIKAGISGKMRYTEYSIAEILMGLANRVVGISNAEMVNLGRCCGKAAFIPFYERLLAAVPAYEDIFVIPEDEEEEE